jgi:hypothetical protein
MKKFSATSVHLTQNPLHLENVLAHGADSYR